MESGRGWVAARISFCRVRATKSFCPLSGGANGRFGHAADLTFSEWTRAKRPFVRKKPCYF